MPKLEFYLPHAMKEIPDTKGIRESLKKVKICPKISVKKFVVDENGEKTFKLFFWRSSADRRVVIKQRKRSKLLYSQPVVFLGCISGRFCLEAKARQEITTKESLGRITKRRDWASGVCLRSIKLRIS